jgi:hypothetical protein
LTTSFRIFTGGVRTPTLDQQTLKRVLRGEALKPLASGLLAIPGITPTLDGRVAAPPAGG